MLKILRQRASSGQGKCLSAEYKPVSLRFIPGEKTVIRFSNGEEDFASCLRCPDTPCASLSEEELIPVNFKEFPADKITDLCPAGAITIPDGIGVPAIDAERCILCGVCASRCPVGAIRLNTEYGAIIEDSSNSAFYEKNNSDPNEIIAIRHQFEGLPSEGVPLLESDQLVDEVFNRMQRARKRVGDRFPNLLARSLLIGSRIGAFLGRKGNPHMRMDIILAPPGVEHGVVEVEFGQAAILDAPRDILDALAVLGSRYEWPMDTTTALIITDMLPNKRSEYWHIIQDIHNVFDIRIGTITIFLLMLFNWNRWELELHQDHVFYADKNTESYRHEIIEIAIGRALHLSSRPCPQIDIVK